jgi:predicted membrane protein
MGVHYFFIGLWLILFIIAVILLFKAIKIKFPLQILLYAVLVVLIGYLLIGTIIDLIEWKDPVKLMQEQKKNRG